MNTLDEFDFRRSPLQNVNYAEAKARIAAFYSWLSENKECVLIADGLLKKINVESLIDTVSSIRKSIRASTPEEIAAVGLWIMKEIKTHNTEAANFARLYSIRPAFSTSNLQDHSDELFKRYINPALDFFRRELEQKVGSAVVKEHGRELSYPREITESLRKFEKDYPIYECNAFIMMRFGSTKEHAEIASTIRALLAKYGIKGHRADDKEYHEDLFPNVLTYMHGCAFGIAVFEQLETESFNPNVSLEVGYMRGLRKSVCLLKDNSLKTLHTDLLGKLYRPFDPRLSSATIPEELEKWLRDKDIITV